MHRAIIIPSSYPEASGYPNQASWTVNAELFAEKLEGVGYRIEHLAPGEDLVRALRAVLKEPDKTQSLLVYFTGYMVLTDQGEPALVLSDGTATALRLSQLAARAGRNFGRVQFLIDAVRGTPSKTVIATTLGRTFTSTEQALATLAGEVPVPENVGMLIGVRRWGEDELAGLALSEVMDAAIHELGVSPEPANSRDFAEWITERQALGSFALAAQHSEPEFVVLPRRRFPSIPHGVTASHSDERATIHAPVRPAFSSVPPPLPSEREASDWAATAFDARTTKGPSTAAANTEMPNTSVPPPPPPDSVFHAVPEWSVPPPPPPIAPVRAGLVLPYPVTIPPQPGPWNIPLKPPSLSPSPAVFPAPGTASGTAPPPLPIWPVTAAPPPPFATHPPTPAVTVLQPILPSPSVSILPPPPLPGTPLTLPAPQLAPPGPAAGAWPPAPPQVVSAESWGPPEPYPESSESTDEASFIRRAQRAVERGNSDEVLRATRQCLLLFPDSVQALQLAGAELARLGQWQQLAGLYEELIGELQDASSAAQLCGAAARVYREQLGDVASARSVLLRGLGLAPTHTNVLFELAELEHLLGNLDAASALSRRALEANPLSVRACRAAQERFLACGQDDWTRTVAVILTFLGQAGAAEANLLQATQSTNLPQPARALTSTDFGLGLSVGEVDPGLTQVFSVVCETMREVAMPKPKAQQRLLDGLQHEDVELSTTTLIRAFGWTCRFLSIQPPQVYLKDGDALPELLPVPEVAWCVGRGLGRGLSLAELAFIWGRALGRARPESRILFVCPDEPAHRELLSALRAAVDLPGEYSGPAKQLAKTLKKKVTQPVWDLVHQALAARSSHQLLHDLGRFRAQAELAANRVGLVACGDLDVAIRTLERFPSANGLTREIQASDLFSYACSNAYTELRQQLGLASSANA